MLLSFVPWSTTQIATDRRRSSTGSPADPPGSRARAARSRRGTRLRQEALADEFGSAARRCARPCASCRRTASSSCAPHRGAVVRGPTRAGDPRGVRGARGARGARRRARCRADPGVTARAAARGRGALPALDRRAARASAWRRRWARRTRLEDWTHANDEFHQAVLDAAGNDRLRRDDGRSAPEHPARPDLDRPRARTRGCWRRTSRSTTRSWPRSSGRPGGGTPAMVEHVRSAGALVTLRFEQRSS